MTCRAARMFSKILPGWIWSTAVSVVRPNLEVFWTSRTFGPHLCLNGTRSLIEWGKTATKLNPEPVRVLVRS